MPRFGRLLLGVAAAVFLLLCVYAGWTSYSLNASDRTYRRIHAGQTFQQVERLLEGWATERLNVPGSDWEASDWSRDIATRSPGYVAVRYTALADLYVDVYYDRNGRVFLAENND